MEIFLSKYFILSSFSIQVLPSSFGRWKALRKCKYTHKHWTSYDGNFSIHSIQILYTIDWNMYFATSNITKYIYDVFG
jgi:hypothetical protein